VIGGLSVDAINNMLYVGVADADTDMAYIQVFSLSGTPQLLHTYELPDDVR
jgi:hypothetical protein